MGALDLFSARRGEPAERGARGATHSEAPDSRDEGRKPGVLVLAAARAKGEGAPGAETSGAQAVCTCGSLIARVSSLLAGREDTTCERCRFFGHYSQ
jgi:hypothetical protein